MRNIVIQCRVSEIERRQIEKNAADMGVSIADFLRHVALHSPNIYELMTNANELLLKVDDLLTTKSKRGKR